MRITPFFVCFVHFVVYSRFSSPNPFRIPVYPVLDLVRELYTFMLAECKTPNAVCEIICTKKRKER